MRIDGHTRPGWILPLLLAAPWAGRGTAAQAQDATLRFDRPVYHLSEGARDLSLVLIVSAPGCGGDGSQILESTAILRAERGGAARPGRDFVPLERAIPLGGSRTSFPVLLSGLVIDDALAEEPETFRLTLTLEGDARVRCLADDSLLELSVGDEATVEIEDDGGSGPLAPQPVGVRIECLACERSGAPGESLAAPLEARLVRDEGGQPEPRSGVPVLWRTLDERLRLAEKTTYTDSGGVARNRVVLGENTGRAMVVASLLNGAKTTFSVRIEASTPPHGDPIPGPELCDHPELLPPEVQRLCSQVDPNSPDPPEVPRLILPDEIAAQGDLGVEAVGLQGRFVRGRLETGAAGSKPGQTGVYAGVTGSSGSRAESPLEAGYDYTLRGLAAGVDGKPVPGFVLGGAVGYLNGEADFAGAGGSLNLRLLTLSAYAAYQRPGAGFHLEGFATWGRPRYRLERAVSIDGSEPRRAVSSSSGSLWELSLGGMAKRPLGPFSLEARGFARWDEIAIDAFEESGAGDLDLAVERQRQRSLVAEAGLRLRYSHAFQGWALSLGLGADALHELADDSRTIEWRFLRGPVPQQSFSVSTERPDRDYFAFEAELLARLPGRWSTFLRARKEAQREHLESQSLVLGVFTTF